MVEVPVRDTQGQTSKYIPFVILFESSQIFLQYTGDIDAKNDGPEFWNSNSVIFEILKKASRGPLQLICTIMAAAKLDHSRVLVTKFCQNWLTLKGRSAGQRHTDTQTNSAENKGPSGLQSGQQFKIQLYNNQTSFIISYYLLIINFRKVH